MWSPIAELIKETGVIQGGSLRYDDGTERLVDRADAERLLHSNDGLVIEQASAHAIAERLEAWLPEIDQEMHDPADAEFAARLPNFPKKLREFIDFCRKSNGFAIW